MGLGALAERSPAHPAPGPDCHGGLPWRSSLVYRVYLPYSPSQTVCLPYTSAFAYPRPNFKPEYLGPHPSVGTPQTATRKPPAGAMIWTQVVKKPDMPVFCFGGVSCISSFPPYKRISRDPSSWPRDGRRVRRGAGWSVGSWEPWTGPTVLYRVSKSKRVVKRRG